MTTVDSKPTQRSLNHVPEYLENSNHFNLKNIELSQNGVLIAQYNHTPVLLLSSYLDENKSRVIGKSDAPTHTQTEISNVRLEFPSLVFAQLTSNGSFVFHLHDLVSDKFELSAEHDLIKFSQCILVDRERVIAATTKEFLLWKRSAFNRASPQVISFFSSGASFRPLPSIKAQFCTLLTSDRVLLGGPEGFQVWKISIGPDANTTSCKVLFDWRLKDVLNKYTSITAYDNTVATVTPIGLTLWDIEKQSALKQIETSPNNVITQVYMDSVFLLTGDTKGLITLRNRKTSEKLHDLNQIDVSSQTKRTMRSFTKRFNETPETSDTSNADGSNRCLYLTRVGRWVVCGYPSGVKIFDINHDAQLHPILEFSQLFSGTLKQVLVDKNKIVMCVIRSTLKDSRKSEKYEKPDVITWSPTLVGFEVNTEVTVQLTGLYACCERIIAILESAQEDIQEFLPTMKLVKEITQEIEKANSADIPVVLISDLQACLEAYEATLIRYNAKGLLRRGLSSVRLRRDIEMHNVQVYKQILNFQEMLVIEIPKSQQETFDRPNLLLLVDSEGVPLQGQDIIIEDVEGKNMWKKYFKNRLAVEYPAFVKALGEAIQLPFENTPLEGQLKYVLDFWNTGFVSQVKFSEFLKGFGPFKSCVENMRLVIDQPWFHGYISHKEADYLLRWEPEGTYLIRFSEAKPGAFGLAFKMNQQVVQILIETCAITFPVARRGYKVREESQKDFKVFPSLFELVAHYQYFLQLPLRSTIIRESWFQGDITSDEAAFSLMGNPLGTFLIRFSGSGALALSYIEGTGLLKHVLLPRNEFGHFSVTGDSITFSTVQDLIGHYQRTLVIGQSLRIVQEQRRFKEESEERAKFQLRQVEIHTQQQEKERTKKLLAEQMEKEISRQLQEYEETKNEDEQVSSSLAPDVDPDELFDVPEEFHEQAAGIVTRILTLRAEIKSSNDMFHIVEISKRLRTLDQHLDDYLKKLQVSQADLKSFIQANSGLIPARLQLEDRTNEKLTKLKEVSSIVIQKAVGSLYYFREILKEPVTIEMLRSFADTLKLLRALLSDISVTRANEEKGHKLAVRAQSSEVSKKPVLPEGLVSILRNAPAYSTAPIKSNTEYFGISEANARVEQILAERAQAASSSNYGSFHSSPSDSSPISTSTQEPPAHEIPKSLSDEYGRIVDVQKRLNLGASGEYGSINSFRGPASEKEKEKKSSASFSLTGSGEYGSMMAVRNAVDSPKSSPRSVTMKATSNTNLKPLSSSPVDGEGYTSVKALLGERKATTATTTIAPSNSSRRSSLATPSTVNLETRMDQMAHAAMLTSIQKSIDAKLDLITPTRKFIRQGNLRLQENKVLTSTHHVMLFNDLILITKEKLVSRPGQASMDLKANIGLEEARVIDVADTETNKNVFELVSKGKTYTLFAESLQDKQSWVKDVKRVKKEIQIQQFRKTFAHSGPKKADETSKSTTTKLPSSTPNRKQSVIGAEELTKSGETKKTTTNSEDDFPENEESDEEEDEDTTRIMNQKEAELKKYEESIKLLKKQQQEERMKLTELRLSVQLTQPLDLSQQQQQQPAPTPAPATAADPFSLDDFDNILASIDDAQISATKQRTATVTPSAHSFFL